MQTILGAGGAIGRDLARILGEYTDRVRLVGRNPVKVLPDNELFRADLLDPAAVSAAVEDTEVAYLVAGLPYKTAVWRRQWPRVMRNVIDACSSRGSKLVFFDNIYMYDCDRLGNMDEDTPIGPCSEKGKVRESILGMLLGAVENGDIEALVARSADFYGPGKLATSMLTQPVFDRLTAGKAAQWLLSADHKHSFTYTVDAARGTALLGNADDVWGQTWHLPTAAEALTGRQWVDAIADELGNDARIRVVSPFILSVMGLLVPVMREVKEMTYQYDRDYVFRSDKFNRRFDFRPTQPADGIEAIVASDYR